MIITCNFTKRNFTQNSDDADYNPFADKQQFLLHTLLSKLSNELQEIKEADVDLAEIISDTEYLKDNIQNFSKKDVIRKISKIFSRLKKVSVKLAWDIFDVAKKEAIKKILYGGIDEAGNFISGI